MTRHQHLQALLGALSPTSIRFTVAMHEVINEIRNHFHETSEMPDTEDYNGNECIENDIAVIEGFLRETR